MRTSVIEVHDMLSVLSVEEVEKRIGEVPGVESVTVNFAAGSATARYDETRLEISDIKSAVRQRGYEPASPHPEPNAAPIAPPDTTDLPPASTPAESKTAPITPEAPLPSAPHEMAVDSPPPANQ